MRVPVRNPPVCVMCAPITPGTCVSSQLHPVLESGGPVWTAVGLPAALFLTRALSLPTAYAWGCGAEAAVRAGTWAGPGCPQCKAAGDWPSSEGRRTPGFRFGPAHQSSQAPSRSRRYRNDLRANLKWPTLNLRDISTTNPSVTTQMV